MEKHYLVKTVLMATVLMLACGLCGCGFFSSVDKALRENKTKMDDKYWAEKNVPPVELDLEVTCVGDESKFDHDLRVSRCVYKYLEDGDKSSLKKMFSESVLDNKEDEVDRGIEELLDYYQTLEVNGYKVESNSMYKVNRVEPRVTNYEYTYHTSFEYEGDRYVLDIMFVDSTLDDARDLIGVHGIRLRNRDKDEQVIVNTIETDI